MAIKLSEHFDYKKLLRAVLPSVLMMVFTSIYSIVDGFFVSNFASKTAFAGLNLIMPIIMIIGAVGFMLGAGGSALTAKTLGEGDRDRANKIFSMIIYFTVVLGAVITAITYIFIEPIAKALGGSEATPEMIECAVLYGRILIGTEITYMLQSVFQSFFVASEKATLGFIVTVLAGVTNMALDALFIVVFRWGLVGAAVATCIGQAVGGIIPLIYFSRKNGSLLRLVKTGFEFKVILKSVTNGSSELLSNIAMSVVSILFNMQLLKTAGDDGVAAYGVIMYAGFIFCAIFIGFSIGIAPIVGYNYGAKNRAELKSLFKKCLVSIGLASVVIVTLTEIFAGLLSGIFVGYDEALLALTTNGFRLYGISFALCGFNIFASGFFTALNDGFISAFISVSRTLVFQVLCVLIVPIFLGLNGVWLSIVFAEVLALAVSVACFMLKRKKYEYL